MKRRGLALRNFRHLAEHLRRSRLIVARRPLVPLVMVANRLEQAQRPHADHVGGIFGLIEGDAHVRLRREIVNLVGTHLLDDSPQPGAVAEVAIMQMQTFAIPAPKPLRR